MKQILAAFALVLAAGAAADDSRLYTGMVVFGDSLADGGNAGIFTSDDPNGLFPRQPAVAFLANRLGLPLLPSCSGLGPAFGGAIPCAPAPGTPDEQLAQIASSVLANGSNWAVGGNRAADVLLDVVGPQRFRQLFPDTTVADHNTLSTILPDSSRCGPDGVCDPALGESPYLSPAEVAAAVAAFGNPAALQALVDDPNNDITLTGVPFATGQGYLPQNAVGRNTLYYLNGGGNDIIQQTLAGTVTPDSMQRSAHFLATAASELKNAGARFVVVSNAPRVGNTPLMNDVGPAAVSGANTGTALFNQSLRREINAIGNIFIMDMEGMVQLALDNPGLFGFANIDQAATCYEAGACANPDPVYSETGSAPNANKLLYNDGVHPTLAGQRLLADYYYSVLTAPVGISLLPDLGYQNTRMHQTQIDHHLIAQRFREPTTTLFFSAGWGYNDLGTGPAPNHEGDSWSGLLGFSFAQGEHFEWALAASYAVTDYDPSGLELKARNWNLSAFARWDNGRAFVDGGVTYGDIDYYRINRSVQLGSYRNRLHGSANGDAWALFVRAGYDSVPSLDCQLGPFLAAEWTRVDVNSFRERANPQLTYTGANGATLDPIGLHVHGWDRDYYRVRGGFFYNAPETARWRWFGELWLEHNGGDDHQTLRVGLNSIIGNSAHLAAYDSRKAGFFQNGAGALVGLNLGENFQLSGNVLVRPHDPVGGLNINYRF